MVGTKEEYGVIKLVSVMGGFDSVSDYVRSLVTADIVAKKKAHQYPSIIGMRQMDWDRLADYEKEQFLNQIGPVVPNSMDHFLEMKKTGPSPMEVGFKQETDNELI